MIPPHDAALVAEAPAWRLRDRLVGLDHPRILGIVNVTPDSFSDGGLFLDAEAAIEHGGCLLEEGADILDIGGESTRPQGAVPVDARAELERVLPVIEGLRERHPDAVLSVDTVKAEVADAALRAGADIINDVSAFRLDPRMGEICARHRAGVILMHSRGAVSDMATYAHATYGEDVTGDVISELRECVDRARGAGVRDEAIVIDPGIGFSKRSEHSLTLLAELPRVAALGHPILVGVSRKRFIGEVSRVQVPAERVDGSIAANVVALMRGARLFRVHDVRASRRALEVAWAIMRQGATAAEGRDA